MTKWLLHELFQTCLALPASCLIPLLVRVAAVEDEAQLVIPQ